MQIHKSKEKIKNYLNSLTKEELINLVLKFAPQNFLDTIYMQFASQDEAEILFKRVAKDIKSMFSDEELLYTPSKFEDELLEQLEKLRGLWDKLPLEIGDLILKIMRDIEEAFEEGYLYIDRYDREDDYFESEMVNDYIFDFFSSLPENIKPSYLKDLKKVLENFGFSTFHSIEKKLSRS